MKKDLLKKSIFEKEYCITIGFEDGTSSECINDCNDGACLHFYKNGSMKLDGIEVEEDERESMLQFAINLIVVQRINSLKGAKNISIKQYNNKKENNG